MIINTICKHASVKEFFYHLILFSYISFTFGIVVFLSNSYVITTQVKILVYIFIPLFCKAVISIMISHVFEATIPQFQIFPILVCTILNGLVFAEYVFFTGKFFFSFYIILKVSCRYIYVLIDFKKL